MYIEALETSESLQVCKTITRTVIKNSRLSEFKLNALRHLVDMSEQTTMRVS